jgi:hypothetical protein
MGRGAMYVHYYWYVARHRWFVMLACFRAGLFWRGLLHDLSKFSAPEWFAYADHFYGRRLGTKRDATGYYKPTDTGDPAFDLAWLHHANHNDHHWQYWTQPTDDGGVKVYPMPVPAVVEMVCDWVGASRAQGSKSTVLEWYANNSAKMLLHEDTRHMVELLLEKMGIRKEETYG